jgi:hypothetical protein
MSANPRSSWVTFGNTNSNTAGSAAPYGKNGIFVGQAYLGWKATRWLALQAGKMPNPLFTTPLVWDSDINPEGLVERLNFELEDGWSIFANFAQYVYSQFALNDDSSNLGFASHEGYQPPGRLGSAQVRRAEIGQGGAGLLPLPGFGPPTSPGRPTTIRIPPDSQAHSPSARRTRFPIPPRGWRSPTD